jgi:hypothetical protein
MGPLGSAGHLSGTGYHPLYRRKFIAYGLLFITWLSSSRRSRADLPANIFPNRHNATVTGQPVHPGILHGHFPGHDRFGHRYRQCQIVGRSSVSKRNISLDRLAQSH